MSVKTKIYTVKVYCPNCEWEGTQELERGKTVNFLLDCPICGAAKLKSLGVSKEMPLTNY